MRLLTIFHLKFSYILVTLHRFFFRLLSWFAFFVAAADGVEVVAEIDHVSSFGISVSTDGGEVHKKIIDFLQLETNGLILAWSLALELSQSLLVNLIKGLLSRCQTIDMGFQM